MSARKNQKRRLALFGATGSIGRNCLQIIDAYPDDFSVEYLSANKNVDLVIEQALQYRPKAVALVTAEATADQRDVLKSNGIELMQGPEALLEIAQRNNYDLLVNAIVGAAGMLPTVAAIKNRKDIALANKETLVVGGEIVMALAKEYDVSIIPIDSEHSAIFQCLMGEQHAAIKRIILTASGGPFLHLDQKDFANVTVEQALKHPNWDMGAKITIDSATMMNKGLEVIEAYWLFDVPVTSVDVVIHPQSIVHSMVEFVDGSIKAQLGMPDMRVPIQLALTYPDRKAASFPKLQFSEVLDLNFFPPDINKFRALALAYKAIGCGGTMPAVMNAANEIVVQLFLQRKIHFGQMPELIEQVMNAHEVQHKPTIENFVEADSWAREYCSNIAE